MYHHVTDIYTLSSNGHQFSGGAVRQRPGTVYQYLLFCRHAQRLFAFFHFSVLSVFRPLVPEQYFTNFVFGVCLWQQLWKISQTQTVVESSLLSSCSFPCLISVYLTSCSSLALVTAFLYIGRTGQWFWIGDTVRKCTPTLSSCVHNSSNSKNNNKSEHNITKAHTAPPSPTSTDSACAIKRW